MDNKHPRVVVGAFIRNSSDELLLVRSPKWSNKWVVGGGHVDYGETYEQALIREVKEEYNLDVEFKGLIKVVNIINSPEFYKPDMHFVGLQCDCFAKNPETIKLDGVELTEYQWFSLEDAANLEDVVEVTKKTIIELYQKEKNED